MDVDNIEMLQPIISEEQFPYDYEEITFIDKDTTVEYGDILTDTTVEYGGILTDKGDFDPVEIEKFKLKNKNEGIQELFKNSGFNFSDKFSDTLALKMKRYKNGDYFLEMVIDKPYYILLSQKTRNKIYSLKSVLNLKEKVYIFDGKNYKNISSINLSSDNITKIRIEIRDFYNNLDRENNLSITPYEYKTRSVFGEQPIFEESEELTSIKQNSNIIQTDLILPNGLIDATDKELEDLNIFSNKSLREIISIKNQAESFSEKISIRDYKNRTLEDELFKTRRKLNQLKLDRDIKVIEEIEFKKENAILENQIDDLEKNIEFQKQEKQLLLKSYDYQINRIKIIVKDLLIKPNSKISLKDRIKLLFKLEGITITSIITVITMFFTTIGLSISNSLKPSSNNPNIPDKPNNNNSIQEKVKDGLKKLANYLYELAKKSVIGLPGIIASIVGYLLKAGGNILMFAAEHVILFLIAVVSAIIYGLINMIKK